MSRDVRMMVVVAAVAAVAGWLLVRLARPPERFPEPQQVTVRATAPPPQAVTVEAVTARTPRAAIDPDALDPAALQRDLDILAQAVRQDQYMENHAFPADRTILEMPSVIVYVRSVDFWQPAFAAASGAGR